MSMYERKAKISARQPEGDRNGLTQPEVLETLTAGFGKGQRHTAVVEFTVIEQSQSEEGVLTNRIGFSRIEVISGPSADQATQILRDAFAARTPDALAGIDEDLAGRGDA